MVRRTRKMAALTGNTVSEPHHRQQLQGNAFGKQVLKDEVDDGKIARGG